MQPIPQQQDIVTTTPIVHPTTTPTTASLSSRYLVITGASSGIGYATAQAFAARGRNLILVARRKERLVALQAALRRQYPMIDVVVQPADLSVAEQVYALYAATQAYPLEAWINNAGIGHYSSVAQQELSPITALLKVNIEAVTILSTLFVRDYRDVAGAQLINLSSGGGYTIVPNAVTYCASKFYVSAFTEGLAHELRAAHAKLQAKVLAPAATQTEFGAIANHLAPNVYDYDTAFGMYHTSQQVAGFLLQLYDSDKAVGLVDRETFTFRLCDPQLPYAGGSAHNQKIGDGTA